MKMQKSSKIVYKGYLLFEFKGNSAGVWMLLRDHLLPPGQLYDRGWVT